MKAITLKSFAGLTLALVMGVASAIAQGGGGGGGGGGGFGRGGGGFDMTQFMKQMVDNLREPFEVKDEAEWKVIGDQIQKVLDARIAAETSGGGALNMARAFGRRGGAQDTGNGQGGGRRRNTAAGNPFGGTPDPTMEALQKAIDDNASNAELKAAVARFVDARRQRQAKLEQAQSDLRKLLSVRQEAIAYSFGLL